MPHIELSSYTYNIVCCDNSLCICYRKDQLDLHAPIRISWVYHSETKYVLSRTSDLKDRHETLGINQNSNWVMLCIDVTGRHIIFKAHTYISGREWQCLYLYLYFTIVRFKSYWQVSQTDWWRTHRAIIVQLLRSTLSVGRISADPQIFQLPNIVLNYRAVK